MWVCGGHTVTHNSRLTTGSSVPYECQCAMQKLGHTYARKLFI